VIAIAAVGTSTCCRPVVSGSGGVRTSPAPRLEPVPGAAPRDLDMLAELVAGAQLAAVAIVVPAVVALALRWSPSSLCSRWWRSRRWRWSRSSPAVVALVAAVVAEIAPLDLRSRRRSRGRSSSPHR